MQRLLNIRPVGAARLALGAGPLLLALIFYFLSSEARHAANAGDKLLPTLQAMWAGFHQMAFTIDSNLGGTPIIADTSTSLSRLFFGLAISTFLTLILGLALGILPAFRTTLGPLVAGIAMMPPITVLPILFIVLGLGETAKVGCPSYVSAKPP